MGIDRIEHFLGGDGITDDKPAYSSLVDVKADSPETESIVRMLEYAECTARHQGRDAA